MLDSLDLFVTGVDSLDLFVTAISDSNSDSVIFLYLLVHNIRRALII